MKPETVHHRPETEALVAMTERSYDEYNTILPQIKQGLEMAEPRNYLRVLTFEKVLEQELPLTTARRAYVSAIRIAMGEKNVYREYIPPKPKSKRKRVVKNAGGATQPSVN